MKLLEEKDLIGGASVIGGVLAIGNFAALTAVFPDQSVQLFPVAGAIAVAGLVLMVRTAHLREARKHSLSLSQRLRALDFHAMVNIVDENNPMTEVHDQLLERTCFEPEDLIGLPVAMLFAQQNEALADEIRSHLVHGEIWQGETPLNCAGGSTIYTQATVMPPCNDKRNWYCSMSARTDATANNEQVAQRETAEIMHELHNGIRIGTAQTERLSYMNEVSKRRLDWNSADLIGKAPADMGKAELKILVTCWGLNEKGETTENFGMQYFGAPSNVSIKYLENCGRKGRFLVLVSNITERMEREQRRSDFISTVNHELRSLLTSIRGSMGLLLSDAAASLRKRRWRCSRSRTANPTAL